MTTPTTPPTRPTIPVRQHYSPSNWYWLVAQVPGMVYSSKAMAYIPLTTPAYVTWLAGRPIPPSKTPVPNVPTNIATCAALQTVLTQAGLAQAGLEASYNPTDPVGTAGYMLAQAASIRWSKVNGGMTYNGVPTPTDVETRTNIMGAAVTAMADPTYTLNWKINGAWQVLTAAQVTAFASAMRSFVQACFNNEQALDAQINAATTVAQLQAINLQSGWPPGT